MIARELRANAVLWRQTRDRCLRDLERATTERKIVWLVQMVSKYQHQSDVMEIEAHLMEDDRA